MTASEPAAACTYESAGWSCAGTGFLWFSGARTGDETRFPCPRCNAAVLVAAAEARVRHDGVAAACICCGPSVAAMALEYALEEVSTQRAFRCEPG